MAVIGGGMMLAVHVVIATTRGWLPGVLVGDDGMSAGIGWGMLGVNRHIAGVVVAMGDVCRVMMDLALPGSAVMRDVKAGSCWEMMMGALPATWGGRQG